MDTNEELRGPHRGNMSVQTKDERGMVLSKDFGFTIEEENGKVLAFDVVDHSEHGISLLFGNQVFMLKFWDKEDLQKGLRLMGQALVKELERRQSSEDG